MYVYTRVCVTAIFKAVEMGTSGRVGTAPTVVSGSCRMRSVEEGLRVTVVRRSSGPRPSCNASDPSIPGDIPRYRCLCLSRVGTVHRAFVPWILERLHHRTWCAPQQVAYIAYTRGWARARRQPEPDSDWGPQTAPQAPCSAIARRSVASGVVLTRGAPHAPPGAGTWSSFRPCWRRVGPSLTAWRPSYIHTWLSSGPPHRVCGHTRPFAILYMTGVACFVSL